MSWKLVETGDGDRDDREQAENRESALSIFPAFTSFCGESDTNVGEKVELPFDMGEDIVADGLDACAS